MRALINAINSDISFSYVHVYTLQTLRIAMIILYEACGKLIWLCYYFDWKSRSESVAVKLWHYISIARMLNFCINYVHIFTQIPDAHTNRLYIIIFFPLMSFVTYVCHFPIRINGHTSLFQTKFLMTYRIRPSLIYVVTSHTNVSYISPVDLLFGALRGEKRALFHLSLYL